MTDDRASMTVLSPGRGYIAPTSLDEALRLLAVPGHRALAGGTTLVDLIRCGVAQPRMLVDLQHLEDLHGVAVGAEGWRIGSATTMSQVAGNAALKQEFPALAASLELAASVQIRNQATIGGNLLQSPRCVFYRDVGAQCAARDGGHGCAARESTLGPRALFADPGPCLAPYPGDLAVALLALDATVELRDCHGTRGISIDDLIEGGSARVPPGHLLTHITLGRGDGGSVFVKRRTRASFAFATASAAAAGTMTDGIVSRLRVVVGAQASSPRLMGDIGRDLVGTALEPAAVRAAVARSVKDRRGAETAARWCQEILVQALDNLRERIAHDRRIP